MKSFDLNQVRLLDGVFARRQLLVREYLIHFDMDRLLHTFKLQAGLESQAEALGGWESPECTLRGHFVGHFLSACAKLSYGLQDVVLSQKANAIVDVFERCMDEEGYLSAFDEGQLDILEERENSGVWAPYYVFHKILAGLVDCGRYLKNQKAIQLAERLAMYIYRRFEKLSYWKIDNMLRCTRLNPVNEFGGIGDALYSLYELRKNEKVLELAKIFDRDYWIGNLSRGKDILTDLHANTHIPMTIAAWHRYSITKEASYKQAALNFYEYVKPRTLANGNNSSKAAHPIPGGVSEKSEHWGAAGLSVGDITGGESESCCAHNMERILEYMLQYGDQPLEYLEHLETLKYNAVLNSASNLTGLSQYHQPMGEKCVKKFSTEYEDFWCCTGSGVEAMAELQKNIWMQDGDAVLINMFVPSVLQLPGGSIEMQTRYPWKSTVNYVIHTDGETEVCLRWKAESIETIRTEAGHPEEQNGFITLRGRFKDGEQIHVTVKSGFHKEYLSKEKDVYALKYDRILLAKIEEGMQKNAFCWNLENEVWIPLYDVENEVYTVYSNSGNSTDAKDGSSAY